MPVVSRSREAIEGAAALDAQLANLGSEVATRLGARVIRKAAVHVQTVLKAKAPHRPGVQLKYYKGRGRDYGDLRDNLKVRKVQPRNSNYVLYDVTTGNAFWGYILEHGWEDVAPQPWARPAVAAMKDELIQIQIQGLGAGIERAARRAGGGSGGMMPNGRSRESYGL